MPDAPTPDLPELIEQFRDLYRPAARWSATDSGAEIDQDCADLSARFTAFLRSHGIDAYTVQADQAAHPYADMHRWTRLRLGGQLLNVDWTARQMRTLDFPRTAQHASQTEQVPLVWAGTGPEHPVADLGFARIRTLAGND